MNSGKQLQHPRAHHAFSDVSRVLYGFEQGAWEGGEARGGEGGTTWGGWVGWGGWGERMGWGGMV